MKHEKVCTKLILNGFIKWLITVLLALSMVVPFLWMLSTSLKPDRFLLSFPPKLISTEMDFSSYRELFMLFPMLRMLLNSILVSAAVTFGQLLLASSSAYAFARMSFWGSRTIFLLFLGIFMVPTQVVLTPLFIITRNLRWLNTYQGIIFPLISMRLSFAIFLLYQYFKSVPFSFDEAAFLEGAHHGIVFGRVILPLVKPALAILFVLFFMESWNTFLWPLLAIRDTELMTLPVGLSALQGRYSTEWNLMMAGAVISVLPIILVFLSAQKQFLEGMVRSGIKG